MEDKEWMKSYIQLKKFLNENGYPQVNSKDEAEIVLIWLLLGCLVFPLQLVFCGGIKIRTPKLYHNHNQRKVYAFHIKKNANSTAFFFY